MAVTQRRTDGAAARQGWRWCPPSLALAVGLAGSIPAAVAGPDEDFLAGRAAYLAGDVSTAMAPLERAAAAGHPDAQVLLASILDGAEENARAVELYRLAAAKGHAEAEFGLAGLYAQGEGTARDLPQALALYRKSAEKGYVPAMGVLAEAHLQGQLGLQVDREQGLAWLRRAADLGNASARARLVALEGADPGGGSASPPGPR